MINQVEEIDVDRFQCLHSVSQTRVISFFDRLEAYLLALRDRGRHRFDTNFFTQYLPGFQLVDARVVMELDIRLECLGLAYAQGLLAHAPVFCETSKLVLELGRWIGYEAFELIPVRTRSRN